MTRLATLLLLIAALALSFAPEVTAFGLGKRGAGFGKLGAAASKGSNGIAPVACGTGVIDLSAGCPLPMIGS